MRVTDQYAKARQNDKDELKRALVSLHKLHALSLNDITQAIDVAYELGYASAESERMNSIAKAN